MRRINVVILTTVVLLGPILLGGGKLVTAQDTDLANHPLVGAWMVDSEPENPQNIPDRAVLSADGTMINHSADSSFGVGVWESTGDTTATVTFTILFDDGVRLVVHVSLEVATDGQSFRGTYTNEFFVDPTTVEGSGQIGPGTVEATRLVAEAPGTPVASFEEFFGESEATPAATPVS